MIFQHDGTDSDLFSYGSSNSFRLTKHVWSDFTPTGLPAFRENIQTSPVCHLFYPWNNS